MGFSIMRLFFILFFVALPAVLADGRDGGVADSSTSPAHCGNVDVSGSISNGRCVDAIKLPYASNAVGKDSDCPVQTTNLMGSKIDDDVVPPTCQNYVLNDVPLKDRGGGRAWYSYTSASGGSNVTLCVRSKIDCSTASSSSSSSSSGSVPTPSPSEPPSLLPTIVSAARPRSLNSAGLPSSLFDVISVFAGANCDSLQCMTMLAMDFENYPVGHEICVKMPSHIPACETLHILHQAWYGSETCTPFDFRVYDDGDPDDTKGLVDACSERESPSSETRSLQGISDPPSSVPSFSRAPSMVPSTPIPSAVPTAVPSAVPSEWEGCWHPEGLDLAGTTEAPDLEQAGSKMTFFSGRDGNRQENRRKFNRQRLFQYGDDCECVDSGSYRIEIYEIDATSWDWVQVHMSIKRQCCSIKPGFVRNEVCIGMPGGFKLEGTYEHGEPYFFDPTGETDSALLSTVGADSSILEWVLLLL